MSHKKTPPAEGPGVRGYCGETSGLGAYVGADLNRQTLAECPRLRNASRPLRPFKVEHAEFCRLVISPRWRHRNVTLAELEALRLAAAWRTIRAALRQMSPADVIEHACRMAAIWPQYCALPNCPPPFEFSEMDSVCMAQDAMRLTQ